MTNKTIEYFPQVYARTAGALYLLVILFGGFAEGFVMNTLVVSGDAAATAHNITAASGLWQLSVAGNLIVPLIAVAQLWIEYLLLKPVSKNLSLLFALFSIVSLSVEAISKLFLLMVTHVLGGAGYGNILEPQQLYALSYISLTAHDLSFNIALIFFGCSCILEGYLIFMSGYLPRIVGILMQLAGVSYLVASFSALFATAFSTLITPAILIPSLIGESSLSLWLLVKGVNVAKWNERVMLGVAT